MSQNTTVIALAIIVAGGLIAGALYFSNNPGTPNTNGNQNEPVELSVRPIQESDYVLGDRNASIILVEYSDLECPFCKRFHTTMKRVLDEYDGDIAWVYRHFPLTQIHPNAPAIANAAECAGELGGNQAFWDYVDGVFERAPEGEFYPVDELGSLGVSQGLNQTAFNACVDENRYEDDVREDFEEAVENGGRGTPYTVVVLKEKLSDEAETAVLAVNEQLGQPLITVSEDGKQVGMSGALSYDIVTQVLDAVQL